ncbi:hypothetical protein DACRYDRAFT_23889 [Dacryopinax primogenitus]|uniref:Uncharacterized protein n=1 Tax=Dacryopinax primogenitus (strain DJM 731) TaxID=1858805 RepID=M5G6A3_DACPD|nr:uncharacterized protein DACRYDRAFT_23889 [Dacryopinax primogenitus]EJT99297.1 hypothetical protein DACRYDRAFT_23889 [Dacryopinax primogenitus]
MALLPTRSNSDRQEPLVRPFQSIDEQPRTSYDRPPMDRYETQAPERRAPESYDESSRAPGRETDYPTRDRPIVDTTVQQQLGPPPTPTQRWDRSIRDDKRVDDHLPRNGTQYPDNGYNARVVVPQERQVDDRTNGDEQRRSNNRADGPQERHLGDRANEAQGRRFDNRVNVPQERRLNNGTNGPQERRFGDRTNGPQESRFNDLVTRPEERRSDDHPNGSEERRSDNRANAPQGRRFDDRSNGPPEQRLDSRPGGPQGRRLEDHANIPSERLLDARTNPPQDRRPDDRLTGPQERRFDGPPNRPQERRFNDQRNGPRDRRLDDRPNAPQERRFNDKANAPRERPLDDRPNMLQETRFDDRANRPGERCLHGRHDAPQEGLLDNRAKVTQERQYDNTPNTVNRPQERRLDEQTPRERLFNDRANGPEERFYNGRTNVPPERGLDNSTAPQESQRDARVNGPENRYSEDRRRQEPPALRRDDVPSQPPSHALVDLPPSRRSPRTSYSRPLHGDTDRRDNRMPLHVEIPRDQGRPPQPQTAPPKLNRPTINRDQVDAYPARSHEDPPRLFPASGPPLGRRSDGRPIIQRGGLTSGGSGKPTEASEPERGQPRPQSTSSPQIDGPSLLIERERRFAPQPSPPNSGFSERLERGRTRFDGPPSSSSTAPRPDSWDSRRSPQSAQQQRLSGPRGDNPHRFPPRRELNQSSDTSGGGPPTPEPRPPKQVGYESFTDMGKVVAKRRWLRRQEIPGGWKGYP